MNAETFPSPAQGSLRRAREARLAPAKGRYRYLKIVTDVCR